MGRNDPCPCGSGKKYKHCHMKSFQPKESFQVKVSGGNIADNFHLESSDGKNWVKKPGRQTLRVTYYEPAPEIDDVIKPMLSRFPSNHLLYKRITRLQHKLYGIKYHIDNFRFQEDAEIQRFSTDHKGSDHDAIMRDPKLIYEIEAFTFQVKSCLDILAQIIGITYSLPGVTTYSDSGNKIVKSLNQNSPKEFKGQATKLASIISSHRQWADDLIDMRDQVTHYSDLEGFSCFIEHAWEGTPIAAISYPSMPDGERARKYLDRTWLSLLDLIKQVDSFVPPSRV